MPQPPEDEARLLQQMVLAQKMMQQQRQAAEKAKLDQAKVGHQARLPARAE